MRPNLSEELEQLIGQLMTGDLDFMPPELGQYDRHKVYMFCIADLYQRLLQLEKQKEPEKDYGSKKTGTKRKW